MTISELPPNVSELKHPLVDHHLSKLRDIHTNSDLFRQQIHRLAMFLSIEATCDLKIESYQVTTPIQEMEGKRLTSVVALVPILRAGLGLVEPMLQMLPEAEVWHLGMYRDESTAMPVEYYSKLPKAHPSDVAFVLDPMLATGGSLCAATTALANWGVKDIRILSILATQEGVRNIHREHPDVRIWVAKIDPELNSHKFIVPGLGDAGDRIFNTVR